MAKYRAIPQGFMTVGEVAKKMGVTVRIVIFFASIPVCGIILKKQKVK